MQNQKSKIKNQNYGGFLRKLLFKTFKFLPVFLTFNFLLFTLPSAVYAEVEIGERFGFGYLSSLGQLVSQLVPVIFSIATAMVIVYFLWGAFNWLKSGGNKEEVAGARQIITHAIIGFLILMFAFLILQFLLSSLFGITQFQIFQT